MRTTVERGHIEQDIAGALVARDELGMLRGGTRSDRERARCGALSMVAITHGATIVSPARERCYAGNVQRGSRAFTA